MDFFYQFATCVRLDEISCVDAIQGEPVGLKETHADQISNETKYQDLKPFSLENIHMIVL